MALFEIVPNLSEGRDARIIDDAVAAAGCAGARVVNRTSDAVHHRSVLTILGDAKEVLGAAIGIAGVAAQRIDLRAHRGAHPRIGALDVLPFVPLRDATMQQAVSLAHEAARAIWQRFAVPSFFYGDAASAPHRRLLADVRRGEFEGLDARFADERWHPDVGDRAKHESAGAIAIGARPILIAFNVELASGDITVAKEIARMIRERNGGLRSLRAIPISLRSDAVQVSLNITEVRATPLHRVFELVRALARERGVEVARGELIGCVPLEAVAAAARYYLGAADAPPPP